MNQAGTSSKETAPEGEPVARDIMLPPLVTATPDTPVGVAHLRLRQHGTRHLPVVDGERWVGMLSMRDLLRVELGEQGDEIKLLHEYIQH